MKANTLMHCPRNFTKYAVDPANKSNDLDFNANEVLLYISGKNIEIIISITTNLRNTLLDFLS